MAFGYCSRQLSYFKQGVIRNQNKVMAIEKKFIYIYFCTLCQNIWNWSWNIIKILIMKTFYMDRLFQLLNFIYLLLFSFLQLQNLLEIHRPNSIHVCSGNQRNGSTVTTRQSQRLDSDPSTLHPAGQPQRLDTDPSTRHLANICISSSKGSDIISATCIATHIGAHMLM